MFFFKVEVNIHSCFVTSSLLELQLGKFFKNPVTKKPLSCGIQIQKLSNPKVGAAYSKQLGNLSEHCKDISIT